MAYFFGRRLQEDVAVPIGLIADAQGGSPAESWMSPEALRGLSDFATPLAEIARFSTQNGTQHGSFLMHWLEERDLGGRDAA